MAAGFSIGTGLIALVPALFWAGVGICALSVLGPIGWVGWELANEFYYDRKSIQELIGSENIWRAFTALATAATSIKYYGPIDRRKAELFIRLASAPRNPHLQPTFELYNTDIAFYKQQDHFRDLLETLIDLAGASEHIRNYYYFDDTNWSLLRVELPDGRQIVLLALGKDDRSNSHALLIRNGTWVPDPPETGAFPITMIEQAQNFVGVDDQLRKFLAPLHRGWFRPVFPPIVGDQVPPDLVYQTRLAMRDAILAWFNDAAISRVESAGIARSSLQITWLLSQNSEEDAGRFSNWLRTLKSLPNLKVRRYILVDVPLYLGDDDYKRIVDKIRTEFLPDTTAETSRYDVIYINTNNIPFDKLKRDFALFQIDGIEYAQDSEPDIRPTSVDILRVYFTRAKDAISSAHDDFAQLSRCRLYRNFTQFIEDEKSR